MQTDFQYFGQFSGEDYPTFQEWGDAFGNALRADNLLFVLRHFDHWLHDFAFITMLSNDQRDTFIGQVNIMGEMVADAIEKHKAVQE
jgi:hypothetical protein